ncbi:rod shape-determining protein RodA [Candidatus Venteria ishoeyi]|uniref:Peptidoglycan glycosyltransferase MrdB n=3 Tax=Candidatus Venteria ishoeyi TaxID=1899563 RepID=A0A1H6FBD5_9GAMM|nr:rod shape-determining protein RodA [Candidatus Venteria ishoeyi]MDM8546323.1 rod shape-determining protein RodA [Candidatus Venteria ishoeyi]SEH06953.1 Rod shape-determining protein RodA [Candidatus Venteria ishoeyi]
MRVSWKVSPTLNLDIPLLLGLFTLSGISLAVLYSASGESMAILIKQSIRLGIGFFVMLLLAQVRSQQLMRWTPIFYVIGMAMLVAVLLVGTVGKGAQRWLDLGFMRFQPSEIMKVIVPLTIAWYFADKPLPPNYKRLGFALILILIPTLLIAKQPDLGTSLLIAASGIFVLLLAGIPWALVFGALLAGGGAVAAVTLTPLREYVFHPYQWRRIQTLLNPESDPLGSGYHIIQSKIAIGSGGLYGKGWLNGTQSHLEFLPERSTDFIFAVLSEEFGLMGVIALLMVYVFIITRGLYIATQAQGIFGKLVAGSITLTFFVYIFVNIGMVSGLLPVVGLPLPLISYGGTSIVSILSGFGILMGVHAHKRLLSE